MSGAVVMTFEQYAARHNASLLQVGDAALHRSSEHESASSFARNRSAQAERDRVLLERRADLRRTYDDAVARGEIRPPTSLERWRHLAAGDETRESTQAARRILAKLECRRLASGRQKDSP